MVVLLLVVTGIIGGLYFFSRADSKVSENPALGGKEITVYKTPTCGCCAVFISYLEKKDVAVKVENVKSLDDIKKRNGIPPCLLYTSSLEEQFLLCLVSHSKAFL